MGLIITGLILNLSGSYIVIFIFLALIQNIGIIPFLLLDHDDFEIKKAKEK